MKLIIVWDGYHFKRQLTDCKNFYREYKNFLLGKRSFVVNGFTKRIKSTIYVTERDDHSNCNYIANMLINNIRYTYDSKKEDVDYIFVLKSIKQALSKFSYTYKEVKRYNRKEFMEYLFWYYRLKKLMENYLE